MGQMLGCSPVCCGRPQPCLGRVSASLLLPQTMQGCLQRRLPRPLERVSCAPGAASLQSESLQGDKTHFSGDMGVGWQPQLRASCHGEKPSWEPPPCVGPKLIFAVAGGTTAQPGQLRCPSLPYHSCVRLRHGAGPTAPRPKGTAMAKHVCGTARSSRVQGGAGPRLDRHRAAGVGCLIPHPAMLESCSAGMGKAVCQALVSVRCLPEGVWPLPFSPPQTLSPPCTDWPCSTGWMGSFPRIPERLPQGTKGPAQPCVLEVGQTMGKYFGAESCCFGECLLSEHWVPNQ